MHKRQNRSDIGRNCHGIHQHLPTTWTEIILLVSTSVNITGILVFKIFLSMTLSIPLQIFVGNSNLQCPEKRLLLKGDFSYMDTQDRLYRKLSLTASSTRDLKRGIVYPQPTRKPQDRLTMWSYHRRWNAKQILFPCRGLVRGEMMLNLSMLKTACTGHTRPGLS